MNNEAQVKLLDDSDVSPPDLFLFLLEGVSNELDDLGREQVDAAADRRTNKRLRLLNVMRYLGNRLQNLSYNTVNF